MLSAAPALRRGLRSSPSAGERWQSGRSRRTRNAEYVQAYRGFESLPLRHALSYLNCECILPKEVDSGLFPRLAHALFADESWGESTRLRSQGVKIVGMHFRDYAKPSAA